MADADDKEKAEKLAAAKKRFEQLKKQKQSGAKKGAAKKKDDKTESTAKADDAASAQESPEIKDPEQISKDEDESKAEANGDEVADGEAADEGDKPMPTRTPSVTQQSRQRSESFRKGAGGTGVKSPPLPEGEVQEVYRKQAARIEELEKQVESLGQTEAKLHEAEEELEQLREGSGDVADLKNKAGLADQRASEIEKLKADLTSTQRQLTQAQQAANKNRRASGAGGPNDLTEQLASKTSTIESLELELSNLRYQVSMLESEKSTHESHLRSAEERATAAEAKASSLESEIQKLQDTISTPTADASKDEGTEAKADPDALQNRITVLESELRTARASTDADANKATNLESKIETLTKLHRESSTQNAAREKEIKDLKSRIKNLTTTQRDAAGEDLSDLEEEERDKLHARIRDLEAENFELRRGVWRDKRAALQPGMDEPGSATGYEDVDLNGAPSPYGGRPSFGAGGRQSSTFSDVLQSGISAFTGRENPRASSGRKGSQEGTSVVGQRKQSLGLLSEEGFDEDAFRVAQEQEAMARLERIREVKRGLEQWRGWKIDLVDSRQGGLPGFTTGPVFEV